MLDAATFPRWMYGPDGQAGVFQQPADVPTGWVDHPGKLKPALASPPATRDPFDHDGDGKPGGSLPKGRDPRKKVNRDGDGQ